ncbi:MAG: hypothetical protein RI894_926, partial [Bacteroidota bacterium]
RHHGAMHRAAPIFRGRLVLILIPQVLQQGKHGAAITRLPQAVASPFIYTFNQ